jgi:hypothetical protein
MTSEEWNRSDGFILDLFFSRNPMDRGFEGLAEVLAVFESLDDELRPDRICFRKGEENYSRQLLRKKLRETYIGDDTVSIRLARTRPPEIMLSFTSRTEATGVHCSITLDLDSFDFLREPGTADRRAEALLSFVRALASRLPILHGMAHSTTDLYSGTDPHMQDTSVPRPIYEAFWLNVYGPEMVRALGRERVLTTPAAHVEELPGGAILWLSRPTPGDFASEEARLAQARALVHLRPELSLESTLATLRKRSLAFTPIPIQFEPDMADILMKEVQFQGLKHMRSTVERFNRYHPPPVSEWIHAAQAPATDVSDVKATLDTYEGLYAEQLIALLHEKVPAVLGSSLEALPQVDYFLWHHAWGRRLPPAEKELLVQSLGAWLGGHLVTALGGRWVPRRKLEESTVIIGDRAWLPFLRARHAMQGEEAPLDFSCTQFFRTALRLARPQAH